MNNSSSVTRSPDREPPVGRGRERSRGGEEEADTLVETVESWSCVLTVAYETGTFKNIHKENMSLVVWEN